MPVSKRIVDVGLILATLPVWLPLLLLIACVVAIVSGRPVFFVQKRMGENGRPFNIVKFRTMVAGRRAPADAVFEGWTYRLDPRVFPVGRFLRRYRLDELPQVYNVFRGEMSLVGPRPEPWDVAMALGRQIPGYFSRYSVRPGLTGLCQVSDEYYDFDTIEKARRKYEIDCHYVEQRSLSLDLRIMLRSIPTLIRRAGIT